ncbi:sporulation protein YqfC [Thermincola ferriacetica]|uniref:Sporulation protein YqfC n=2 Tax=Thermincola TaxID=278993 RepID=D5XAR0_THEPJ|nr:MULTISPECIES: sporulation protein YqfC [Thermincola]ADG83264.1 sporulation protein YqfC [Thermincola potens JR]KNZ68342.1 sporulation protein YqfC [Thermincola ferriacetica]
MSWKDQRRRFGQQFANFLDIPKDVLLDLPKIIMVGNFQVIIENHKGILEYTDTLVRINTSIGEYAITGTDLSLRSILPDEISVEGKIDDIKIGA